MSRLILDAHAHCGLTVPFEELLYEWDRGGIDGGVVFSPVEEVYDRYDPSFTDSPVYRTSRDRVHQYLLDVAYREHVYPYFFVWNDFPSIPVGFAGIKWHRHSNEPLYRYDAPGCEHILNEICSKDLPIVLEEEFRFTLKLIELVAGRTVVIIPHMGGLNGGYKRLLEAGVFDLAHVWVDSALADHSEIYDFAARFGVGRMLFGSDYPFGMPAFEKRKLEDLFDGKDLEAVLFGNLSRLLDASRRGTSRPIP